jgi:hypothetical protein
MDSTKIQSMAPKTLMPCIFVVSTGIEMKRCFRAANFYIIVGEGPHHYLSLSSSFSNLFSLECLKGFRSSFMGFNQSSSTLLGEGKVDEGGWNV